MVARKFHMLEVMGSSPIRRNNYNIITKYWVIRRLQKKVRFESDKLLYFKNMINKVVGYGSVV